MRVALITAAESATPRPARIARRCERDLAIVALAEAGLTTREISLLRIGSVRVLPSGNVLVRPRIDDGILRGAKHVRPVPLTGRQANRVARYFATRADEGSQQPLFAGRRPGAPLRHTSIAAVVSYQRELSDRRER